MSRRRQRPREASHPPSTEEPGVPPVFALDKRGRARPLVAVRRPVTGVFNSYSVLADLADEAGAAGADDFEHNHAEEAGAAAADDLEHNHAEEAGAAGADDFEHNHAEEAGAAGADDFEHNNAEEAGAAGADDFEHNHAEEAGAAGADDFEHNHAEGGAAMEPVEDAGRASTGCCVAMYIISCVVVLVFVYLWSAWR